MASIYPFGGPRLREGPRNVQSRYVRRQQTYFVSSEPDRQRYCREKWHQFQHWGMISGENQTLIRSEEYPYKPDNKRLTSSQHDASFAWLIRVCPLTLALGFTT